MVSHEVENLRPETRTNGAYHFQLLLGGSPISFLIKLPANLSWVNPGSTQDPPRIERCLYVQKWLDIDYFKNGNSIVGSTSSSTDEKIKTS